VSRRDAVVVGAGPAGSVAAHELARAGADVLLLDRRPFPRWKVCGACLSPGAQAVLRAAGLGELPARLGAQPLREMVLTGGTWTARVRLGASVAISRRAFDSGLADAACRAGASFRSGARATLLADADAGATPIRERPPRLRLVCDGVEELIETSVVIDATGLGAGLGGGRGRPAARPGSRVGLGAVFDPRVADIRAGELHMAVGRSGYVGMVRLEDGCLDVAAAVDAIALRGGAPETAVAAILAEAGGSPLEAQPIHGWRGTPPLTRWAPEGVVPGVYPVGDAAGYVEPFTGEGIAWAMADGLAVATYALRALEGAAEARSAASSAAWREARRRRARRSQRLCRTLAAALRRPVLVRLAGSVLGRAPRLARPVVGLAARPPVPLAAASR